MRRAVDGQPLVLVSGGKLVQKNLAKARVSVDEVFAAVRGAGLRGMEQVAYVILEQAGKLSVVSNEENAQAGISHAVVIDGRVQERALENAGKTAAWLDKELAKRALELKKLLYLCIDDVGEIRFEMINDK